MNHNLCIICYQENEFATISDAMPGCHCHQFRPTLCYECVYAVCKCRRNDDDGETEGERYQEDEMDDLIEEFDALHLLDEREENEMNELIHDFDHLRIFEEEVEWDMEWDHEWEPNMNLALYN